MTIRLEMNAGTLAAVIGGDSEVELNVRKAIVHEFAKRHLQAVAEAETFKLAAAEVKQLATEVATEAFGETQVKARIAEKLAPFIDELIAKRFEEQLKCRLQQMENELLEKWKRHLDYTISGLIRKKEKEILANLGANI